MKEEQQALTRIEPLAVVPSNPMELMSMAIQRGADVGTIERIAALYEKFQAAEAKRQFDDALASFQAECPIIIKAKQGAKNAYKYAPLDAIIAQTRDLLRKHGFSFSVTSVIEPGWVQAQCKITHCGGHSQVSEFKVPVDAKNPMMSDPQRYGGSMTFAKRYSFCNGFGILTADEDMDAGARPKPPGPSSVAAPEPSLKEHAQALWNALVSVRGPEKNWKAANEWLWREEILDAAAEKAAPDLTAQEFKDALRKTTAKLAKP